MDGERVREIWERAGDLGGTSPQGWLRPGVPTFAGVPAARRPEELNGASAAVLGIPWQSRSEDAAHGPAGGPAAIRRAATGYAAALRGGTLPEVDRGLVPAARLRVVDYGDVHCEGGDPGAMTAAAHERLIEVVAAGAVPLVLGGDAAVATPALQVLCGRLTGKLGIVAFTAGLGLCGAEGDREGGRWRRAFELGVVEPEAFVQIGVRAAATAAEVAVAAALGHSWYTVADVDEAGVEVIAQEALEAATRGTEAVYLSVDVGVLDLPGGDGAEPGGLSARELLRALRVVARAPLGAVDVSGVPGDGARAAASIAARAVLEVVAGLAQQFPEGQGAGAVAP